MEEAATSILELALEQGVWAALYIYLFFRMLKENKEREERYQATIDHLSVKIEKGIEDVKKSVDELSSMYNFESCDVDDS